MKLLKQHPKLSLALLVILVARGMLLQINVAEVGDSYNLLTAAESITHGSYPETEKRLPLLPLLLSLGLPFMEGVLWGRFVVLGLSLATLLLSYMLYRSFVRGGSDCDYVLVLFLAAQSLFAFWSMRIMTDVLFLFLIMLSFVIWVRKPWKTQTRLILLGVLAGLAAATRFEGYLLIGSFVLPYMYRRQWREMFTTGLSATVVVAPWWFRNMILFGSPFYTSYGSEATQYIPDINLIGLFFVYLIFLIGPLTPLFVTRGGAWIVQRYREAVVPIIIFMALLIPLALVWTAAIPRLLLPFVPLWTVMLFVGIEKVEITFRDFILLCVSLVTFMVCAVYFRIDFLTGSMGAFIAMLSLTGLALLALWSQVKGYSDRSVVTIMFSMLLVMSQTIVASSVISQAQYRSSTTVAATEYVNTLEGKVGYADETGVSSWYLREKGLYWNGDTGFTEALDWMRDNEVTYLVLTNEHFEEGATFLVVYDLEDAHRFRLLKRFEREPTVGPFNQILERFGYKSVNKDDVRYAEVYEILSYREADTRD